MRYIGKQDLPEWFDEKLTAKCEVFIAGTSVTEAVGKCFSLQFSDLVPLLAEDNPSPAARNYHLLLAAAMFYFRTYQDEQAYGSAIRLIADSVPESRWPEGARRMVQHYRQYGSRELIGKSKPMRELVRRINLIAPHEHARVLILGESGTGKETVALQIHNKSPRRDESFIAFNCASVTPNLLESRFLGHEKGAFTGATETKRGVFEQADGGTLFLDEIGELPLEAQGTLLRVLEGGRFTRVGDQEEVEVDVRLVAATNRDLPALIREGRFREDLFFRLNVVQLRIPPLRERKDDIAPIADNYWMRRHRSRLRKEQHEALVTYDYPGNVRELYNLLERATVLKQHDFTALLAEQKEMLGNVPLKPAIEEMPDELEAAVRLLTKRIFKKHGGNITKTAEAMKVAKNTVRKHLGLLQ